MALTGWPEGPPRFAAGGLATAARGVGMALRHLAPRTPLASLDAPALLGERAAIAGLKAAGDTSVGGSARLLASRDGALALNLPRDEDWELVPAWLAAEDASFVGGRDWKRLAEIVATRDPRELEERGRLIGLAVAWARRDVPADRSIFTNRHPTKADPHSAARPIRLLDLSNLWAGPLAGSLLGMAGIDVLKVESPARPDGARRGPAPFFDLMNAGKRSCALDLNRASDRETFQRLLEGADIVLESSRARALTQFGFDAVDWVAASPGRIWASITGHGRSHEWIAFGDDAAVAAGLAWSPDGSDTRPCFCADAVADPTTGLHVAAIVLAHLRSGRGGLLDFSLVDVAAQAANVTQADVRLPIERIDGLWHVVDQDRAIPIAKPRARTSLGRAPSLAPIGARSSGPSAISEWIGKC